MLGILANYHKYEARNAMLVRFEDLVDEGIMKRVREAASISLLQAREWVEVVFLSVDRAHALYLCTVHTFRKLTTPQSPLCRTWHLWCHPSVCLLLPANQVLMELMQLAPRMKIFTASCA